MQKTDLFLVPAGKPCPVFILRYLFLLFLINGAFFQSISAQDYFQQNVNYKIDVSLDDRRYELNAFEHLEYFNQSPDTLYFLYFHLWPNGYSNNETPLARQLIRFYGKQKLFKDAIQRGYIDSLRFQIGSRPVKWEYLPDAPDIAKIYLNDPLLPGDSIEITTPFRVKIPEASVSRFGHTGDFYQISQWYPKPAVYDKTGWHAFSYLDQGEYYAEFGNFVVNITLPDNYTVGATGELHNKKELERMDRLAADTSGIGNKAGGYNAEIPSSTEFKTLKYTAQNVHDFAWFASKQFHVTKDTMKLPHSGRIITIQALFPDEQAELWKSALEYSKEAIAYFSKNVGDYPYDSYTAVQSALVAGVGMEYPGIAVFAEADDAYSLDEVLVHEIGHNWFYAALGFNERRYPYLDESLTSSYTQHYMRMKYPGKKLWNSYLSDVKRAEFLHIDQLPIQREQEYEWLVQARKNLEQPINFSSTDLSFSNYDLMIYNKGERGFNYLRAYLGDSVYNTIQQDFYRKWKFKHPQPEDLRQEFETHTNKNLDWFFDDYLGTTKRIDYKMKRVDHQQLLVKNKGQLAAPFLLAGIKNDSVSFKKWVAGFEDEQWIKLPEGNYSELKIDPGHIMPEINRLNNNIRTSGFLPKADPVRLQLLFTLNDPEKQTIIFVPVLSYTQEDKLMPGLVINNGYIIPRKIEYFLAPFYSFHSSGLNGFGNVLYRFTPYNSFIREGTLNFEGTRFGAPGNQKYFKLKTGMNLFIGRKDNLKFLQHEIFTGFIAASDIAQIKPGEKAAAKSYVHVGYRLTRAFNVNPFSIMVMFEYNTNFRKVITEWNYRLSYRGENRGLNFHLFAGSMLKEDEQAPFYSLAAAGRSGTEDYLLRGTFPDRFNSSGSSILPRQMLQTEGGLVSPVNQQLGYSQRLLSLSITSELPGLPYDFPIKPFATVLLNDHGFSSSRPALFSEAGIKTGMWNVFEFYIPFWVSGNIKSHTGPVKDRIRFVFSLDTISKIGLKHRNN